MKPVAAITALLALSGCGQAPSTAAPAAQSALDCAGGFDRLAAQVAASPDLKLAASPGEPYRYYNSADAAVSWVVTLPDAPAHPAVVRQTAGPAGATTEGCAYGDKAAYEALLTYLKGLARGRAS